MLNLSLIALKLISKSISIKGYKIISEDRLSNALNAWESMKKSLKNFADTKPTRNKDYDAGEILKKTTKPDPTRVNKTRVIRKENCDKDKILRDLDLIFDPKKYNYEPKKTICAFNNNYINNYINNNYINIYKSIGDKYKILSIKEYIDIIRPYLGDIVNNHKTQWKIYLTIAITFILLKILMRLVPCIQKVIK